MESARQPLADHLRALRKTLLRCLIVIGVMGLLCFGFAGPIFHWLTKPYTTLLASQAAPAGTFLQTLAPAETLQMSLKLSMVFGIAILMPYLIFEIWRFVSPALTTAERRWLGPSMLGGTLLFAGGAVFAFYVVVPMTLRFFWDYSLYLGIAPTWTVGHYMSFVLSTLVAFGLAFELPLVTTLLALLGIVRSSMLTKGRRYAILLICIGAAVLTPPDIMSLILMAIPLIALYELSILITRVIEKRRMIPKDIA